MARRRPPGHPAGAGLHAGGRSGRHRLPAACHPRPTASTTASTCSIAGPRCGTAATARRLVIRQAHSANWWLPVARPLAAALPARRLGGRDPARRRPRSPPGRSYSRAAAAPPATSSIPGSRWTRTGRRPRNTASCGAARWPGAGHGSWCSRPIPADGCTPAAASTTSTGPTAWRPGDELILPRFAGLHTTGGFGAASREWHAWQLAHVLGRGDDRPGLTAPGWAPAPQAAATPVRFRPARRCGRSCTTPGRPPRSR